MRKLSVLFAGMLIVACGNDRVEEQTAVETQTAIQAAGQPGQEGFALLLDNDTIAVERYSRNGNSLNGAARRR
jgi:hypothetical protein